MGAVAVACSNSSSSGGGEDGGGDAANGTDGGSTDAPACTPVLDATTVTTIDGGALWACFNTAPACGTELMACAADCVCDNAMLLALNCVAEAGGASAPANAMMGCVVTQLGTYPGAAGDTTVSTLLACLTGKGKAACEPEGGTSEAGTEGGTEAGTEGGGSEGGSEGGTDAGGG
jgi:hypothetical protein